MLNIVFRVLASMIDTAERIGQRLRYQRTPLTGLDAFEPGCTDHAYCHAVSHALDGHAVTVLFGSDPEDGSPTTFMVWRPVHRDQRRMWTHTDLRVRGAVHAGFASAARADAVQRGVIAD